jgi:histidinol phosphatase-like enzyme
MSIVRTSSSSCLEFSPLARFWADELGRPIVVVRNQSGIGRGYFDEQAYADLTHRRGSAPIARVYHCPIIPSTASASTVAIIPGASPIPE